MKARVDAASRASSPDNFRSQRASSRFNVAARSVASRMSRRAASASFALVGIGLASSASSSTCSRSSMSERRRSGKSGSNASRSGPSPTSITSRSEVAERQPARVCVSDTGITGGTVVAPSFSRSQRSQIRVRANRGASRRRSAEETRRRPPRASRGGRSAQLRGCGRAAGGAEARPGRGADVCVEPG